MAVFRHPPKCPNCGELIQGIYRERPPGRPMFVGDDFIGWDWEGHFKTCEGAQLVLAKPAMPRLLVIAYQYGVWAFDIGQSLNQNPYVFAEPCYHEWIRGWNDAKSKVVNLEHED